MPIFEFGNWLYQTTTFYTVAIPFFLYLNNFAGPKAMEPVFCRDYIMAQFDKMAGGATQKSVGYTPTPGKVPRLPKQLFARGPRSLRLAGGMASLGLLSLMEVKANKKN